MRGETGPFQRHISLAPGDRRRLRELLGLLQEHLETVIDCHVIAGTDVAAKGYRRLVATARKDWKDAERLIKLIEAHEMGNP
jgi:hypothetical protein